MNKRILQILALAVCLGLLPAVAYAKGGKGGGPPADKGKSSSGHASMDRDKHHDEDNDRDEHHAGHAANARRGPSSEPKGWDQGKKKGWGDCEVPPGQAKKRGCDEHGLSARERAAHRGSHTVTGHSTVKSSTAVKSSTTTVAKGASTSTATTSKASRPGQTRAIILQRDATKQAVQK